MTVVNTGCRSILNFHGIGIPPKNTSAAEARYWVSESQFANIVSCAISHRKTGQAVAFTFDDGNFSDIEIAAPMLHDSGFQAEFFVLSSRIGEPNYLDSSQIRELQSMGMSIGLHGKDHVDWRKLSEAQLLAETVTARAVVTEILGCPINSVAIPFGAYNSQVIAWLKAQCFTHIYTSDGGRVIGNPQIQARTSIRSDMNDSTIEAILAGRESTKSSLRRLVSTFVRQNLL